jgi:hypothetical protein
MSIANPTPAEMQHFKRIIRKYCGVPPNFDWTRFYMASRDFFRPDLARKDRLQQEKRNTHTVAEQEAGL